MSREVVRTSVTDPNGKLTTYAYDDADRLLSVTDTANCIVRNGDNGGVRWAWKKT